MMRLAQFFLLNFLGYRQPLKSKQSVRLAFLVAVMPLLSFVVSIGRERLQSVVDAKTTFGTLKAKLAPMFCIPLDMAMLSVQCRAMSDDDALSKYVEDDSEISLKISPLCSYPQPDGYRGNAFGVYVYLPSGRLIALPVFADHPVQHLLDEAHRAYPYIAGYGYVVYWCGKALDATKTLRELCITGGGDVFDIKETEQVQTGKGYASDAPAPSSSGEGRSDGLRKVFIQSIRGVREVDMYLITFLQNIPHVSTDSGCYQVSKHFTQTRNCLFLNRDEGEERVPSADDKSDSEESDSEESIPDTSMTMPTTEQSSTPAVEEEPEPVDATVNSIAFAFGGNNYEMNMDGIKTLSQLRGKIGDVLKVAPKDVRMFVSGDEITARGGTHCRTVGIINGSRLEIQLRGRGGGRVVKHSTKQVKQTRMNTKIAERMALMQDISQTAPMNVRNIPEVVAMGTTVQNFMTALNANGATHALTHHLQVLKQNHPQNFQRCLDHMKSSGTNSASVKLNTIAGDFFLCDGVFNLSEALKTALEYPKNAINIAFEKAVVETNFTLTDFIRLFETVNALSLPSTGTVPVSGTDASMTAP